MFLLEPAIVARLRTALTGIDVDWSVMGKTTDDGKRSPSQLASVAFLNGNVADSKGGGVSLETAWRVTLSKRHSEDAAEVLDKAFAAVIGTLHNWPPGEISGRLWERMRLSQVVAPQYAEDALDGVHLVFITAARFAGHR